MLRVSPSRALVLSCAYLLPSACCSAVAIKEDNTLDNSPGVSHLLSLSCKQMIDPWLMAKIYFRIATTSMLTRNTFSQKSLEANRSAVRINSKKPKGKNTIKEKKKLEVATA